jgi:hypothetical protein
MKKNSPVMKDKVSKTITAVFAGLLVTGCAVQLPKYQPTVELSPSNSFGLRVSSNGHEIRAYKFDDRTCSSNGAALIEISTQPGLYGINLNNNSADLPRSTPSNSLEGEVFVQITQPTIYLAIANGLFLYNGEASCKGFIGFSPVAGRSYDLRFDIRNSSQCLTSLVEIEKDKNGIVKSSRKEYEYIGKDVCPNAYNNATGGFVWSKK